nr:calcium/proton exchanger [Tanacetum cinerariifolium]
MVVDEGNESSDAYCSSDNEDLSYVVFYTQVDDNGITYLRHDPTHDWNEIEPVLGMRQVLVLCGRDVETGRCAGYNTIKKGKKELADDKEQNQGRKKSFKFNKVTTWSIEKTGECTSKFLQTPMKATTSGDGCSESPKWTKAKITSERVRPVCGFRLYVSWMSFDHSFQINSLKLEHKCSRNYNLDSLVTNKWVAHHYAKQLIADPFLPYLKMKTDIKKKYIINVSIGQRPRKNMVKAQSENNSQVSIVERKITCTNCQETGYNKSSYQKEPMPKPPKVNKALVPKPHIYGIYASEEVEVEGQGGRSGIGGRGEGRESSVTITEGNDGKGSER